MGKSDKKVTKKETREREFHQHSKFFLSEALGYRRSKNATQSFGRKRSQQLAATLLALSPRVRRVAVVLLELVRVIVRVEQPVTGSDQGTSALFLPSRTCTRRPLCSSPAAPSRAQRTAAPPCQSTFAVKKRISAKRACDPEHAHLGLLCRLGVLHPHTPLSSKSRLSADCIEIPDSTSGADEASDFRTESVALPEVRAPFSWASTFLIRADEELLWARR